MRNYDKYIKSLAETPGPVKPSSEESIDLRGLRKYLLDTGKNASELSDSEMERFIIPIKNNKAV